MTQTPATATETHPTTAAEFCGYVPPFQGTPEAVAAWTASYREDQRRAWEAGRPAREALQAALLANPVPPASYVPPMD